MLESCRKLQHVEISMNKGIRDRAGDALQTDQLWFMRLERPNVFHIYLGHYWNSNQPVSVSDGKTLLQDDGRIVLRNAPASPLQIPGFDRGGPFYSPLFDFMQGRSALKMVSPDGDIRRTNSGFTLQTKDLGEVDVTLTRRDGYVLPLIIDVSNLAGRMANYRLFPMFSDRPEQPMERYVMNYNFAPAFPRGEFEIRIRKGAPVEDQRKKG